MLCYDLYFITKCVIMTSPCRHNGVFRDEIRVIAPYMSGEKKKKYNFDPMQLFLFSGANTLIVFAFKTPLILTIYGHVAAGSLNFFNYL